MYTFNDSDAQKWTIEQLVTQPSNIQLSHTLIYTLFTNSNLALDLPGNSSANGTKLQIYTSNNSAAQKFTFSPVENNYYVIKNQTGKPGKVSCIKAINRACSSPPNRVAMRGWS